MARTDGAAWRLARWAWRPRVRWRLVALALALDVALLTGLGAGGGHGTVLDLRLAYTPAEALAYLRGLPADLRPVMMLFGAVDLVFAGIYGLLLVGALAAALGRAVGDAAREGRWPLVLAVALLGPVADWVETGSILWIHGRWALGGSAGGLTLALAWAAAVATPIKWGGLSLALLTLSWLLLRGRAAPTAGSEGA